MTNKIIVDQDTCIGCNTCPLMSPDIFELNQDTYKADVKKQPEAITTDIQNTVDSCPVAAISVIEE